MAMETSIKLMESKQYSNEGRGSNETDRTNIYIKT